MLTFLKKTFLDPDSESDGAVSQARYRRFRQLLTGLMIVVSVAPLLAISWFSHLQYVRTLESETTGPLSALARKSATTIELYLRERSSTVSFIAHAYTYRELLEQKNLQKVFLALKSEYQGFVDMGVVSADGIQVDYVGPYGLKDANYSSQQWLEAAQINGVYISNSFLGLRGFPHMVIAVHRMESNGDTWTLRVTVDTSRLQRLLPLMDQAQDTDIFLCDSEGNLQTASRLYGKPFQKLPFTPPPPSHDTLVDRVTDNEGSEFLIASASIEGTALQVLAVKPQLNKPWLALRGELVWVLCGGILAIVVVSYLLIKILVGRLETSDRRRVAIFAQIEQDQKLSSIGRLATGVAHEINNPLAIIAEKAGLAQDLLSLSPDPEKYQRNRQHLLDLMESINSTVERAKAITRRMLGFARRMEVSKQELHVEDVIAESKEFIERAARNKGIELKMNLQDDLPQIISDRGQLQQVFLNILGNAMDALESRKSNACIEIRSQRHGDNAIDVLISDNGQGMPEEVQNHIFEPFYSTKKEKGTGLGMFITYGIVKRLGGTITVKSRVGEGTTFTITLPISSHQDAVEEYNGNSHTAGR